MIGDGCGASTTRCRCLSTRLAFFLAKSPHSANTSVVPIVTGIETLLASQQFPVHIYEMGGENYVHFVDYITFMTNKLNPAESNLK